MTKQEKDFRGKYVKDYREQVWINLLWALIDTRVEPGLPLTDIAEVIKEVFDKAEIRALIKSLKENL